MRLSQIEYFLAVAKHGNITAAAKEVYISQPALSKQIAALEQEIGTPLLVRKSRGIELTEAGKVFEKDLRKVFHDLDLAKKHALEIATKEKLTINLGCFEGHYINDVFQAVRDQLWQKNPDIQIVLHQDIYIKNVEKLKEDALDLIVIFAADKRGMEGYRYKKILCREAAFIYSVQSPLAAKEHLRVSDFADQPFLVPRNRMDTGAYRYDLNMLSRFGIQNPEIKVMDNFITLMTHISLGIGYCILSQNVVNIQPDLLTFVPEEPIYMDILAVWKESNQEIGFLMD